MNQSKEYKRTQKVDVLGDLPGADRSKNLLRVSLVDSDHDLTTKLAAALASEAADSVLVEPSDGSTFAVEPADGSTFSISHDGPVALEAKDGAGNIGKVYRRSNALRVSVEADQAGIATETTLASRLARDLELEDAGATGTFANVHRRGDALQVSVEADQVDMATQTTLAAIAAALKSNGTDTLQVEQQGVIDVSSRDARNLGDVDVTALPDADEAHDNGAALGSGGTITHSLAALGADTLRGRVVRSSTSYDVEVDWKDAAGNVLFTDVIASAVAAGTETSLNEPAISAYADVRIVDAGAASGAVTSSLHLR